MYWLKLSGELEHSIFGSQMEDVANVSNMSRCNITRIACICFYSIELRFLSSPEWIFFNFFFLPIFFGGLNPLFFPPYSLRTTEDLIKCE